MLSKTKRFFKNYNLITVAVIVFVVCYIINPSFISTFSLLALFQDTAIFGFLVLGQALVLLTGCIDLSVGNMASMSSVVAAWLMTLLYGVLPDALALIISILVPLAFCALLGFINGINVSILRIPPLIATLGMMWIVQGIGYYFLRGVPTPYPIQAFWKIFAGGISLIPYSLIYLLVVAVILSLALTRLRWGRSIYATGGNEYAAHISGIKTKAVKRNVYMLSGLFAGFAGLLVGAYSAVGYPRACDGYELTTIAAVVMGGISLTGGEGRLWNAIIGIFILRLLNKLVLFSGQTGYVEGMIVGTIIVLMLIYGTRKKTDRRGLSLNLLLRKSAKTGVNGGKK